MLNNDQHAELKRLLKLAIDGNEWDDRNYALREAAQIVGVISDKKFIGPAFMKAGRKPRFSEDELRDVIAAQGESNHARYGESPYRESYLTPEKRTP